MPELDERLELAVAIALEASAIPRQYFAEKEMIVEAKADDSPVTRADKETEVLLRQRIEAACAADAIVGEEFPDKEGSSGFKWYLDPIDGTQSFIRGVPMFGTMVALQHGDESVIGVIVFPALGEMIYAAKGRGAWWATNAAEAKGIHDVDRRVAQVSTTEKLEDAALACGGLELFPRLGFSDRLSRLLAKARVSRGWCDCYGHYLVATGRMDAIVDPEMFIWDNAPLLPIIEEAGGRFTDLSGSAVIDGGNALSTNGLLHDAVLSEWRD